MTPLRSFRFKIYCITMRKKRKLSSEELVLKELLVKRNFPTLLNRRRRRSLHNILFSDWFPNILFHSEFNEVNYKSMGWSVKKYWFFSAFWPSGHTVRSKNCCEISFAVCYLCGSCSRLITNQNSEMFATMFAKIYTLLFCTIFSCLRWFYALRYAIEFCCKSLCTLSDRLATK